MYLKVVALELGKIHRKTTAANNDLNVIINITILYYCVWKKSRKGSLSEKLCDTILTKICCSSFVYCN